MRILRRWYTGLVFIGFICAVVGRGYAAEKVFYRYIDDKGVKVLNHTIPPKYAQKGYEIVGASGQVIRVVEPALPKELAVQMEKKRQSKKELDRWDASLRRRYSSIADIESAKKRKLLELEASMSILQTTILGLKEEIELQQSKAANIERAGRVVPDTSLTTIKNMQIELEDRKVQVEQRTEEYRKLEAKYDRDIERFKEITKNQFDDRK